MGLFNFIETFFFISLGITFVLILLLVYHFKQRMVILEQKGDTMFEIINNIVKELSILKQAFIQRPVFSQMPTFSVPPFMNGSRPVDNEVEKLPVLQEQEYEEEDEDDDDYDDEDEDEDEDDEEDEPEDEDDEEDEPEVEDDEEDEHEVEDDEEDEDEKEVVQENLLYDVREDEHLETTPNSEIKIETLEIVEPENVKIINVNLDDHNENQFDESDCNENFEEHSNTDNDNTEIVDFDESEPVVVNKLEESIEISKIEESETNKEDINAYKKISLQQLKTLVISKGLATDVGKLKKNELIRLLESGYK